MTLFAKSQPLIIAKKLSNIALVFDLVTKIMKLKIIYFDTGLTT